MAMGLANEGVWMLCPQLYAPLGKVNYRDESFTMVVNAIAKWPPAYRKMYQQNKVCKWKKGRELAGDEWVESHLVRPITVCIRSNILPHVGNDVL